MIVYDPESQRVTEAEQSEARQTANVILNREGKKREGSRERETGYD